MAFHDLFDPSFEGGLQIGYDQLMYHVKKSNGSILQRVLKEDLFINMLGLRFDMFHVFFEIFERKVEQLITGGIINYYIKQVTEDMNPKRYEHLYVNESKVLTMKHLEAGFVIWLFALSFAVMMFTIEWLIRLRDFLVFKYVFTEFCKQTERMKEVKIMLVDDIQEGEEMIDELRSINIEDSNETNHWELENILPSGGLEWFEKV